MYCGSITLARAPRRCCILPPVRRAAAGSASLEIMHACAGMAGLVVATLGGAPRGQPSRRTHYDATKTSIAAKGGLLAAAAVRLGMNVRSDHDRASGFTLIEMIVVLVILGLMLGLVVARGPLHSQRLDTEAAARGLAGALRVARGRALAQHRPVVVSVAANAYRVDAEPPHAMPADVALSGNAAIRFAPDGSSSGGQIAVQSGTGRIGIAVDWLTGRVSLMPTP
jgi:general secretion pathway protein H